MTQSAGVGGIGPRLDAGKARRVRTISPRSVSALFDADAEPMGRFRLCERLPEGGGPGGGPGSGMPGCQPLSGDSRPAEPEAAAAADDGPAAGTWECTCPADAALLAAGGRGTSIGICAGLLVGAGSA